MWPFCFHCYLGARFEVSMETQLRSKEPLTMVASLSNCLVVDRPTAYYHFASIAISQVKLLESCCSVPATLLETHIIFLSLHLLMVVIDRTFVLAAFFLSAIPFAYTHTFRIVYTFFLLSLPFSLTVLLFYNFYLFFIFLFRGIWWNLREVQDIYRKYWRSSSADEAVTEHGHHHLCQL